MKKKSMKKKKTAKKIDAQGKRARPVQDLQIQRTILSRENIKSSPTY
jgi:hypothetical protein